MGRDECRSACYVSVGQFQTVTPSQEDLRMFNPILTSLRGIQQASELKKVQKK